MGNMGIKLNMHIKLITTQVIHTHGYNTVVLGLLILLYMYNGSVINCLMGSSILVSI